MNKIEDLNTAFKIHRGDIEDILSNLTELASVPAPPLKEDDRRKRFLEILKGNKITESKVDEFGNVLIPLSSGKDLPIILIATNIDSAFDHTIKHSVLFSSDKAMGPGVGENVIALSILPILYRIFKEQHSIFNHNILIAATTGGLGNGDFYGMRGIIKKYSNRIKSAIILRGIDFGRVGYQSPTISRQIITVRTKNIRKEAITWLNNPICILSSFIRELDSFQQNHPGINSINIPFFRGGNDFDGITSLASLGLEIIAEEENALFELEEKITNLLKTRLREENQFNIEVISSVLPGGIDKEHEVLKQLSLIYDWISKNDNIPVKYRLGFSTSEASIPMSQDILTLELGITNGMNNRYLDDFIYLKPILSGIKQVLFLIYFLNEYLKEK